MRDLYYVPLLWYMIVIPRMLIVIALTLSLIWTHFIIYSNYDITLLPEHNHNILYKYIKLIIQYLYVSLQDLLNLRIHFIRVKEIGVKHIYSIHLCNELLNLPHDSNDLILSVQYVSTVNELYSMVAEHHKISVEHVVLLRNSKEIICGDTALYLLFQPSTTQSDLHGAGYVSLLSEFGTCPHPMHCAIAKKINDDPIIMNVVQSRSNAWEVFAKVFNISLEVQNEIKENSENDHIRCVDLIHRMYHNDEELTWEFVEVQV